MSTCQLLSMRLSHYMYDNQEEGTTGINRQSISPLTSGSRLLAGCWRAWTTRLVPGQSSTASCSTAREHSSFEGWCCFKGSQAKKASDKSHLSSLPKMGKPNGDRAGLV